MERLIMKTMDLYASARDQLMNLDSGITLVILHPDFHGQHTLIAPLLEAPNQRTVFLAIPKAGADFKTLSGALAEAVRAQLDESLDKLPAKPQAAAEAVAKVVNDHSPVNLVIDGFDLLDPDPTADFLSALAAQLSGGSRLVIGGRQLPMDLLWREELQPKIALVPVNPDQMMLDYTQSINKTVLEVRALGPGRVLINGRLVEHWDGVLPRTLFFYFVDRGMTTRDEIFRTFWPSLSTREATNVFHVTKRKISEILGTDLTVYWSGFYRLSPDLELHYDVVKFAEAVQNAAVADDKAALALYRDAVELYHGPFLSTMEQDWVVQRRGELATTYAEALAGMARLYAKHNNQPSALGSYLRAAATSPEREDLARAIMELYRTLGQPQAAIETYERLEAELRQTLNVAPGPQTTELVESIRASM
jgi:DNA-binding SARP family transcriptional activator